MASSDSKHPHDLDSETQSPKKDCSNVNFSATTGCPFLRPDSMLQLPRLGIIHLIIWTGVAAVVLKYMDGMGHFDQLNENVNPVQWFVQTVHSLVMTLLSATVLTGCSVLLAAKIRGQASRLQPGHWIVLISGLLTILSFSLWPVGNYVEDLLEPSHPDLYPVIEFYTYNVHKAVMGTASMLAYLFVAIRLRDAVRWRVMVWSFVVGSLVSAVADLMCVLLMLVDFYGIGYMSWFAAAFPIEEVAILPIIGIATWMDFKLRIPRDWLHWTGLVCAMFMGIWEITVFFLYMFVPQ